MITYIIQVVLFQILFLAVYDFFLSKETFYKYNRWYLLGTPILSFVLPLIKIPTFQKAMPQEIMILLPEVMLSPQKVIEQTTFYRDGSFNYLNLLFWIGALLFTIVFLIKLFKIIWLITKNETIQKHFYRLVLLPKENNAFSFFNYIFLGKNIPAEKQESIIEHELIHAKQKHSVDLLFFELLKIVMWFNPMIYFYQHKITLLHEYISDAAIIKNTKKQDYFNTLLSQTFQVENISFVNQFYKHSLIKKRIIMMTKNKSKQIKKAKYLLLLPLLASMLVYTSCEKDINLVDEELKNNSEFSSKTPLSNLMNKININDKSTYEVGSDFYFKVKEFVLKNTNISLDLNKNRVLLEVTITPNGGLEDVKIKNIPLDFEAGNMFNNLPRLIKVKKDGKYVAMKYTLPITYSLNNKTNKALYSENNNDVPFAIIEEVPVYPGCKGTREQKKKCLNENIKMKIVKEFNADLAKSLDISKGKKKIWVVFRINENGEVTEIKARAPHPKLKDEAERVASLLPKMIPGKQRGKAVGMKYTLPISFVVE
ncbi:M56 family metallopeptidase [Polaribacter uvawellassae]|uniref:M56 family metallopeptidase n=1 Tax=Polaribacter uvawellassae TaxID=3133495 RepID=UPI00321A7796